MGYFVMLQLIERKSIMTSYFVWLISVNRVRRLWMDNETSVAVNYDNMLEHIGAH